MDDSLNIALSDVGRRKINQAIFDKLDDALKFRLNQELPPIGSVRDQVTTIKDTVNGMMYVMLRKEYVSKAYFQTFKTTPINDREIMTILETAENVQLSIDDPDDGTEEVGQPYLSSVTGRAIEDVARKTVAGQQDGTNRLGSSPTNLPIRRGWI